jgi:prepilin-type processing-associated H-X9-DG protein
MEVRRRWGITLIELVVVVAIIGVLAAVLLLAIQRTRASARNITCSNHLRQIGIAIAAYENTHQVFPPSSDRYMFTMHVHLLPFLERTDLWLPFANYRDDPDTEQETYEKMAASLPLVHGLAVYRCPDSALMPYLNLTTPPGWKRDDPWVRGVSPMDFTSYLACEGAKTALHDAEFAGIFTSFGGTRQQTRVSEVRNGLSNTVAVSEGAGFDLIRAEGMHLKVIGFEKGLLYRTESRYFDFDQLAYDCWQGTGVVGYGRVIGSGWVGAGPENSFNTWLPPNSRSCLNRSGGYRGAPITPSSHHGAHVNTCFADGSVRSITDDIDWIVWQNMGRIAGAMPAPLE